MQSNDQRGPGRATMTSTAVMAVVVLVTGLAVGAGATWLALSRDDDGVAASADGCAEFRSVDLVVAPEMYSVVVAALADVTPDCVQVDPALRPGHGGRPRRVAGEPAAGRLDPGGALRRHRGLPRSGPPTAAAGEEPGPDARDPRGRRRSAALRDVGRRRGVGPGVRAQPGVVRRGRPRGDRSGGRGPRGGPDPGRRPPAPGPLRAGPERPHRGGRGRHRPAGDVRASLAAAGGRHRAAAGDGGRSCRPPRPDPGRGHPGPRLPPHGRRRRRTRIACPGAGAGRAPRGRRWGAR